VRTRRSSARGSARSASRRVVGNPHHHRSRPGVDVNATYAPGIGSASVEAFLPELNECRYGVDRIDSGDRGLAGMRMLLTAPCAYKRTLRKRAGRGFARSRWRETDQRTEQEPNFHAYDALTVKCRARRECAKPLIFNGGKGGTRTRREPFEINNLLIKKVTAQ
jgi:hypothetical protein